jgi:hypothetical protein
MEEECKAYIEYRMAQVGWDGSILLSTEAYESIFHFTRGVPRKINSLMDRVLLYGFLEDLQAFDDDVVQSVVAEVSSEMFQSVQSSYVQPAAADIAPAISDDGVTKDVEYYKTMLAEMVEVLDDAIGKKAELLRYIESLVETKHQHLQRSIKEEHSDKDH